MDEKTADDAARELLLVTASQGEANAAAVQSLLARNASLRTNDELIDDELRADPGFRAEWERTALGRELAVELLRYRAKHDLSQRDLAERLGLTPAQVADMEVGDVAPERDALERAASLLEIEFTIDPSPS